MSPLLIAAAREAALAATDAHGTGCEPAAAIAYAFINTLWQDTDMSGWAFLPDEMPEEFEAEYEAALAGVPA